MKFKKGDEIITTFNPRVQAELKEQGYEVLTEEKEVETNRKIKKAYNE